MNTKGSKSNYRNYSIIFIISFLSIITGCSNRYILVPVQNTDERIHIDESNSAFVSDDNFTIEAGAEYKNEFILFRLSIENKTEHDITINNEDITILDGKGVIQNILDEKQIENIYYDNFYISFFPTVLPLEDPIFYPDHRAYFGTYYRFRLDRKLFLKNLYKEKFNYGKIPSQAKLVGDIYIQNDKVETPLTLIVELNESKFNFNFDKNLKSKN